MVAINKTTGALIEGVLERVQGRAGITDVRRKPGGPLEYEHNGETKFFYDESETMTDEKGSVIFLDENGEEVCEDNILVLEPDKAEKISAQIRAAEDLTAIRHVLKMLRQGPAGDENAHAAIDHLENCEVAIGQEHRGEAFPAGAAQPA